ncbi:MAG TPA: acyl-CoA thioesterase [Clostridia bacterium]|nr:acyl-CoA thioesterase [Clostridia bacterium]
MSYRERTGAEPDTRAETESKIASKTVAYSRTVMSRIMLPSEANPAGNVHGGEIMKFMDTTAFVTAVKHCRTNVVTARVDELEFYLPILVGQLVTCKTQLVFVGKSSMEIAVRVQVEDLKVEEPAKVALTAYFTMVALDDNYKPTEVPGLKLKTPEEEALFKERQEIYLANKHKRKGK